MSYTHKLDRLFFCFYFAQKWKGQFFITQRACIQIQIVIISDETNIIIRNWLKQHYDNDYCRQEVDINYIHTCMINTKAFGNNRLAFWSIKQDCCFVINASVHRERVYLDRSDSVNNLESLVRWFCAFWKPEMQRALKLVAYLERYTARFNWKMSWKDN